MPGRAERERLIKIWGWVSLKGHSHNLIKLRAVFRLLNLREKQPYLPPLMKHLTYAWHLRVFKFFGPLRLSSIDMKYHIWKLGVVFTDNVSVAPGETRFGSPGSGMSSDATRRKVRELAQKGSGIASKTESLKGAGDTSLSCKSVREMGFHLAILRPVHSTSTSKNPLSSLCPQRWEHLVQPAHQEAGMPEKLPNLFHFHSPFSTLPGTPPCRSWATTTTSSSPLTSWISPWASRPWGRFYHLWLIMANR